MKSYFSFLLLLISTLVHGQVTITDTMHPKKWKLGMLGFSTSINSDSYYNGQYSFSNLKEDTKNSAYFTPVDLTNFNEFSNYGRNSKLFQFNFSFHPYSKKLTTYNERHVVRASLVYYKGIDNYIYFTNKFHRQNFGLPAPDTSYLASVTYDQLMDQVGVETSYQIYSPNFFKRFSLMGALGGGINYTVFSQVKETVDKLTLKNVPFTTSSGVVHYEVSENSYQINYYKHNHALLIRAMGYYGLDFRFLEGVNLFLEGRTGFAYMKFLEGKSRIRSFHSLGLGIRFKV